MVFETEERRGLDFMHSLTPAQRARATVAAASPREITAPAFSDNLRLPYQGLRYGELSAAQQGDLLAVIDAHIVKMRDRHSADPTAADSAFYYLVHSPVLIELIS